MWTIINEKKFLKTQVISLTFLSPGLRMYFLNYTCTLFHRIFLIITLKDFIRAVTINFITVCCTRWAFKILIAFFWLITAGGVYNLFFHICKAQTKACQEVIHFIKRLGLIHSCYLIAGKNIYEYYTWGIMHLCMF